MRNIKIHTVLIVVVFVFTTCRKYPEGGWTNRAIAHLSQEGYWKLTLFEVNGIDSTYLIKGIQDNPNFYNQFIKFNMLDKRDKDFNAETNLYRYALIFRNKKMQIGLGSSLYSAGDSDMKNDSTQCFVKEGILKCERNVMNPEKNQSTTWEIQKLKKSEIILTATLINTYKVKLEK